MKLNDRLPQVLEEMLSATLSADEQVRFSLKSDLTLDRRYGDTYLVVTSKRIFVLDNRQIIRSFFLSEIREIKVDELFSGARLVVVTPADEQVLIYYTKAFVPEFSVLCRLINEILRGRYSLPPDEDEHSYCPKCGMPLPDRGDRCPRCLPRLKILMRLLGLVMPYRSGVILLMTMTFVTVFSQMGPPFITKMIVDDVITKKNQQHLLLWIGLMVGCGLLLLLSRLIGGTITVWLSGRVAADLRARLHTALQRLRMNYFNRRESGEIIGRVMHDTSELQHFLIDGLPYFLVNILSFIAIAVMLLYLDAKLALLVFLPVPFLIGGGRWFWQKLIPLFHQHGSRISALHSILGESVQGIKSVKAFSSEARRIREFDGTNENMFGIGFIVEKTFLRFSEVMFWIMSLGVVGVWFFSARRIAGGDPNLTLGTLLAFVGYIWLFYGPMQWFTAIMNWMTHAFSGAERIFAVFDSPPEVYEAPDAVSLPRIRGDISLREVRFSYERGKEIIKGISFDIRAGEMVGLVGRSGAGKSTVINLICRFYDADAGQISVDGYPIARIKLLQLRQQIGMVMQEPFLFNASIRENIGYGLAGAGFAEIVAAAKAANAHDFIINTEDGYDTIVGERGAKLSSGERQRIAIARSLLHNPPILILDEATSSVDTETEKAIQGAMANLITGRTTIVIAHRLSTLRNAKKLIVIDDGRLAETGTHEELLADNGIYRRLIDMQAELSRLKADDLGDLT